MDSPARGAGVRTGASEMLGAADRRATMGASSLRRNSRTATGWTLCPLACSMIVVRGPSLITFLFTTLMFVMFTVLLMIVVLLTTTVEGRTGWRKCRGSTKTYARGEMTAMFTSTEPREDIRDDGCNGAQPI